MIIIGIDPGLGGAICSLASDGALSVVDMPVLSLARSGKTRREIDRQALADLLRSAQPSHVFIEQIWGRAHNDTSGYASASLLISYGIILGITAALRVSVTTVPPQRWKRALAVPKGKDAARARASELMPEFADLWRLKKHDGRADAALLSLFGERTLHLKSTTAYPRKIQRVSELHK